MEIRGLNILLVAIYLVIPSLVSGNTQEGRQEIKKVENFNGVTIEGEKVSLKDIFAKRKIVLVNFWGLRCGACIEEIPKLNELAKKYREHIEFIGINVDGLGEKSLKSNIVKQNLQINYTVLADPDLSIADIFRLTGAPLTVILDVDGNIKYRHENYQEGDEKDIENAIKSIIITYRNI